MSNSSNIRSSSSSSSQQQSQQSLSQQTPSSSQQLSQLSQQSQQSPSLWANVIHKINTQSRQLMKEKILVSSPSSQKRINNSRLTPSSSVSSPIPMWDSLLDSSGKNSNANNNSEDSDQDEVRRNINFNDLGSGGFDDINDEEPIGSPASTIMNTSVYIPPSNDNNKNSDNSISDNNNITPTKKRLSTTQISSPKTRQRQKQQQNQVEEESMEEESMGEEQTINNDQTPKSRKKLPTQVNSPITRQSKTTTTKPKKSGGKNARQAKKAIVENEDMVIGAEINTKQSINTISKRLAHNNNLKLTRTQKVLFQQQSKRDLDDNSSDDSDDNDDYIDSEEISSDDDFNTDFDSCSFISEDLSDNSNILNNKKSKINNNGDYNSLSTTRNTTNTFSEINSNSTTPNLTSTQDNFNEEIYKLRNDEDSDYNWDFNDRDDDSDNEKDEIISNAITDNEQIEFEDDILLTQIPLESANSTTSTKVSKSKKSRKPKVSISKKCGLTFPVSRVHSILKSNKYFKVPRISKCSTVYLTAVLQYLCEELLLLSMDYCEEKKRKRIKGRDILKSIEADSEFKSIFNNLIINSDAF